MRISTAGMNNQMIGQAMRVQSDFANTLEQKSSGLKSPKLSGLDGQAGAAVGLTADIERSEHLSTQAESAKAELEIAYAAVGGIGDLVEGILVDIAGAMGTSNDATSLQASASDAIDNIVTLLNSQYARSYVFSAGATNTQPVDITDPAYDPALNTDYYQGGSNLRTVMLDGGSSVSYGAKANDSAFAETLKALSQLINTSPLDDATMQSAYDTLTASVTDLARVQETLSGQSDTLNAVIDSQTDFQLYAGEMLSSLTEVDVAVASADAAQRQVLLEASFSALSSLKSVSVLNYL